MLGWAATFALLAIASGFAGFSGYAQPRSELAVTFCLLTGLASVVLTIIGTRRALRKKRLQKRSANPWMK